MTETVTLPSTDTVGRGRLEGQEFIPSCHTLKTSTRGTLLHYVHVNGGETAQLIGQITNPVSTPSARTVEGSLPCLLQ